MNQKFYSGPAGGKPLNVLLLRTRQAQSGASGPAHSGPATAAVHPLSYPSNNIRKRVGLQSSAFGNDADLEQSTLRD
jgi:hypothetical protein